MTNRAPDACLICGGGPLRRVDGFRELPRVTSDCRPWPAGGELAVCPNCQTTQKPTDQRWHAEVQDIYRDYEIYFQSGGEEQPVFTQQSAAATPRSAALLAKLFDHHQFPEKGSMLDVGCGNGAMLKSFQAQIPGWSLTGTERSETHRQSVEAIGANATFINGAVADVLGEFDLITLIHSLEHFPDPVQTLQTLAGRLSDGGILLIEVPNYRANPFDLVIADHCLHFTRETIVPCLTGAGLAASSIADDWITRELSVVAERTEETILPGGMSSQKESPQLSTLVTWLHQCLETARGESRTGPIGLFGTSIAANWLFGGLGDQVSFFVDEDPRRAGTRHFDRPVHNPADAPKDATIFMPLPVQTARPIVERLNALGLRLAYPPDFPA